MTIGHEVVHAPEGTNRTIIVLPGAPASRRIRLPDEALEGVDARVVMTERPGFGITPRQAGRTLADHVHQIRELADHLEAARFAVLGWSAGGSYALSCGALLAERVTAVGLASAHVSSFDRPEADAGMSDHSQMIVKGMRDDPEATHQTLELFMRPQAEAYEADPAAFKRKWTADMARASGRDRVADHWLDVVDDVIGKPPSHLADEYAVMNGPLGFRYDDLRVPVRAFHGDADTNVPIAGMRDLIGRLPDAELTECPGETHFLAPRYTKELLRLLRTFD